ncbi:GNAT family N-acetyltransferase [Lacihabitans sp. LS3-19]|uniref:GNAT family N-acetyltransferase n=1 Tax=Lacihabitans sp. LS3-19 TaxID=2487335 RepID=UPI0020CE97B6|nr:GNAT family N-acetyltransferase [Lacihabitans sp. LS3-19]MCP9767682.1 GNAT family N-acetyltransferase [Lacihabitans sp. LS3-19]
MITLRKAVAKDVKAIMNLVNELAVYENAPEQVSNTEERMLEEGFGPKKAFECILAESENGIIGMALYYFRYSTWKGRRLYLEDLVVTESQRGTGAGKLLFDAMIETAKQEDCSGMMWQVLDWNKPAINFYDKYSTRYDEGWLNCHLDF